MSTTRVGAVAGLTLSLWALAAMGCYAGPEYREARIAADQTVIGAAPPPPRVEVVPARPMADAVWVPGFWAWSSVGWRWVPGRYEVRRGWVWVPPRYERRPGGWVYIRGHWRPR